MTKLRQPGTFSRSTGDCWRARRGSSLPFSSQQNFTSRPWAISWLLLWRAFYWWFGLRNARSTTHANPKIFLCLVALAQLVMAVPVILTLTYVAVSVNLPLQDARLLAWDRALGFDFRSFLDFTNHHRELIPLLARSYSSINLQLLVIVLLLPLTGCYRRVAETVCAVTLAILATTLIAALVPAIGVYGELGLQASDFPQLVPQAYYDTLRDVPLVRGGQLHKLSLTQLSGVVDVSELSCGICYSLHVGLLAAALGETGRHSMEHRDDGGDAAGRRPLFG